MMITTMNILRPTSKADFASISPEISHGRSVVGGAACDIGREYDSKMKVGTYVSESAHELDFGQTIKNDFP